MSFRSFSCDLGLAYDLAYGVEAPNQVVGYRYAAIAPTGQFTAMIDSTNIELIEHQLTGRELTELLIQVGTNTGFPGVFALYGYKTQIRTLSFTKEGKNYSIQATWKINDHDTDTSGLPCVALGMG